MTTKPETFLPIPDPPEREPDDMTSVQHLGENGNMHHLAQFLGNPDSTVVSGERFVVPTPGTPSNQRISPDLLIAFNANPALYRQDNSYVISRQGKPPDLVMEIASRRTGEIDVADKPAGYAALGIREYWRFDETGEFHGAKLAGDRLVEGRCRFPSKPSKKGSSRATAKSWTCSSGGRTVSSGGTTPRPGRKYRPSSRSGKPEWQLRPESGSWRRNWREGR